MATFVVSADLKTEFEKISSAISRTKGTILFRRGDPASGLFRVRKGKVTLELESAERIYPRRILGPGSVAGLPASVSGAAYSLTRKSGGRLGIRLHPPRKVDQAARGESTVVYVGDENDEP